MAGRNAGSPGEPIGGGDDRRFDDAWAEIVAELTSGASVAHPRPDRDDAGPEPAADEDAGESGDRWDGPGSGADGEPWDDVAYPSSADPSPADLANSDDPPNPLAGPRDWVIAELSDSTSDITDTEDGFVPPDPGPILGGDPLLTMAWVGFVAAPLGVLVAFVLWQPLPPMIFQLAAAVFVAACAVLVWRMPARRDDDDFDPGAVV